MAYTPLYQDVADRVKEEKNSMDAQAAAQGIYWRNGKAYKKVNGGIGGPAEIRVASFDKNADGTIGGSAGSGSKGPSMYDQLIKQYQDAYESAKAANEARYNEARGLVDTLGVQQRQDINQSYGMQSAQGMQDLISRGLGSSTVVPTMKMGVERERQAATNRLEDMLNRETIDLIQSRQDVYPDMQMLLGLMQNYGQAQRVPQQNYGGIDMGAMMKMMQGMMPQQGGYQPPQGMPSGNTQPQSNWTPPAPQNTTYPLQNPYKPMGDIGSMMGGIGSLIGGGPGGVGGLIGQIGAPQNLDIFKTPGMTR